MKKVIRLTERDLTRIVRRVLNEQPEGKGDPNVRDEGGKDPDYWSLVIKPRLKAAGFTERVDPPAEGRPCYYKCCTYYFKGNHNTGTNLFLDCGENNTGEWKIKVYTKGDKMLKEFDAGMEGAKKAVQYALSLG